MNGNEAADRLSAYVMERVPMNHPRRADVTDQLKNRYTNVLRTEGCYGQADAINEFDIHRWCAAMQRTIDRITNWQRSDEEEDEE